MSVVQTRLVVKLWVCSLAWVERLDCAVIAYSLRSLRTGCVDDGYFVSAVNRETWVQIPAYPSRRGGENMIELIGYILIILALIGVTVMYFLTRDGSTSDKEIWSSIKKVAFAMCVIGMVLVIGGGCFSQIEAGNVGLYKTFGKVSTEMAPPGLVVKAPWVEIVPFNVQQHETIESIEGGSKDKVRYTANIAFIYQIDPAYAGWMYNEIGSDYQNVAISSNVRDSIREVLGKYDAMYAYADGREDVSKAVFAKAKPVFAERHIILLNANFRDYDIPAEIKNAAATKKATEQQIETAKAKVEIEKMNAQALVETGKGIREYQNTVKDGLTDQLIEWRGQEKLVEAAKSGNMIIVVTDGKSNFPFMLPAEKKA
jgi:regulator of protease activity HflC (stomatin/prohibitin superfamily)